MCRFLVGACICVNVYWCILGCVGMFWYVLGFVCMLGCIVVYLDMQVGMYVCALGCVVECLYMLMYLGVYTWFGVCWGVLVCVEIGWCVLGYVGGWFGNIGFISFVLYFGGFVCVFMFLCLCMYEFMYLCMYLCIYVCMNLWIPDWL